MKAIPLGVYVAHTSAIHSIPAWIKFFFLISFIIVTSVSVKSPSIAASSAGVIAIGFIIARIPPQIAAGQILPTLPFLFFITVFPWFTQGPAQAIRTFFVLLAGISAATLLTLTTRITEMLDSLESVLRPLQKWGIKTELISLALSLTIRLIPLQITTISDVLDARKARGAELSIAAFGTPIIVRCIKRARAIAEALEARGVDDTR